VIIVLRFGRNAILKVGDVAAGDGDATVVVLRGEVLLESPLQRDVMGGDGG